MGKVIGTNASIALISPIFTRLYAFRHVISDLLILGVLETRRDANKALRRAASAQKPSGMIRRSGCELGWLKRIFIVGFENGWSIGKTLWVVVSGRCHPTDPLSGSGMIFEMHCRCGRFRN